MVRKLVTGVLGSTRLVDTSSSARRKISKHRDSSAERGKERSSALISELLPAMSRRLNDILANVFAGPHHN